MSAKDKTTKVLTDNLEAIAKKHFNHTLEQKGSDGADFFEVGVVALKNALVDAFVQGIHCGRTIDE